MIAFATVAELGAYLNREIPDGDANAELALTMASDAIRAYCRQTLSAVDAATYTVEGSGTPLLLLPELPIRDVASVKINDEELNPAEYVFTAWGGLVLKDTASDLTTTFTPFSSSTLRSAVRYSQQAKAWPGLFTRITVTYDHGFLEIPGAIKATALSIAARIVGSPAAVRQETIGAYSVTYTNGAPSLLDTEIRNLEPYKVG